MSAVAEVEEGQYEMMKGGNIEGKRKGSRVKGEKYNLGRK